MYKNLSPEDNQFIYCNLVSYQLIYRHFIHYSLVYSKTWLIRNSRDQKKSFLNLKNLSNSTYLKKLSNNLFKISVAPISVINVNFNTCFGSIILHRQILFKRFFSNCHFKLFGENCTKIITIGQIIFRITNYQGFQNNPVNLYWICLPWDASLN
jgi:hypothetical protein